MKSPAVVGKENDPAGHEALDFVPVPAFRKGREKNVAVCATT